MVVSFSSDASLSGMAIGSDGCAIPFLVAVQAVCIGRKALVPRYYSGVHLQGLQ